MPDPYISPSGPEVTETEGGGIVSEQGAATESTSASMSGYSTSDEIRIRGNTAKDMDISYNTISCPCSSYVVNLSSGGMICERVVDGEKILINPVSINNHLIANNFPKVGDRWLCSGVKCEQGDFKWDTLHVVNIKENINKSNSSVFNSKKSNLKCIIPISGTTNLQEYINPFLKYTTIKDNLFTFTDGSSATMSTPISYVDEVPLFEDTQSALLYNIANNNSLESLYSYQKNSIKGILPTGNYASDEKVITSIIVGNKNILTETTSEFDTINNNENKFGRIAFQNNGENLEINIKGINKPIFTITLKDSSGCDILEGKYKNIIVDKEYSISKEIPTLPTGKTSETYDLKISPSADTKFGNTGGSVNNISGIIKMKIYQYKDPTFTFTVNNSTISGATTTATNVTFGGAVDSTMSILDEYSYEEITHTTTISNSNYVLYCKDPMPRFKDLFTKSNIIKKLIERDDKTDTSEVFNIKIKRKNELDSGGASVYQGDVKVGMKFKSTVTKTKTIRKSIDIEINKEPCDNCPERDIVTNKFEVDRGLTSDLFPGMVVTGKDVNGREFTTILDSIDCSKSITLLDHYAVNKNTEITFTYTVNGNVDSVVDRGGVQSLTLSTGIKLPHESEITFEKGNASFIDGNCVCKNGITNKSVEITTTIDNVEYGQEDTTFTLQLDDIVSITPSSGDQYITVGKNSSDITLPLWTGIDSQDAVDRNITITKQPNNGTLTERTQSCLYTPAPNFVGKDTVKFTGANKNAGEYATAQTSEERTIFITVK